MQILLNGKNENIDPQTSLKQLIDKKVDNTNSVVVEYNRNIVKQGQWKNTYLNPNDKVEIISFVGGG